MPVPVPVPVPVPEPPPVPVPVPVPLSCNCSSFSLTSISKVLTNFLSLFTSSERSKIFLFKGTSAIELSIELSRGLMSTFSSIVANKLPIVWCSAASFQSLSLVSVGYLHPVQSSPYWVQCVSSSYMPKWRSSHFTHELIHSLTNQHLPSFTLNRNTQQVLHQTQKIRS